MNKTYTFDRVSNVKPIQDNVAAHTGLASGTISAIQYDDLHRLTKDGGKAREVRGQRTGESVLAVAGQGVGESAGR